MKPNVLSSRLFDRNASATVGTVRAAKYHRHVDCADHSGGLNPSASRDSLQISDCSNQDKGCNRDNHFLFLPETYKPLIDEEAQIKKKEDKKMKKEKYKKVKKNVGKALHSTWKCLMLGLYNFALGYSTPITVAATFVPDFHPGRNRT